MRRESSVFLFCDDFFLSFLCGGGSGGSGGSRGGSAAAALGQIDNVFDVVVDWSWLSWMEEALPVGDGGSSCSSNAGDAIGVQSPRDAIGIDGGSTGAVHCTTKKLLILVARASKGSHYLKYSK